MNSVYNMLRLLRLSQWSKAGFVALGLIYSGRWAYWQDMVLAALSFCLLASAVYIYNDIHDRESDRLHPRKKNRPLAQQSITLPAAMTLMSSFMTIGMGLAWMISTKLALILACYLLLNLAYNHGGKSMFLFDVLFISLGFMLRVLAGTLGIGLPLSRWLLLVASLLSLFIALGKRQLELKLSLSELTRTVLHRYKGILLPQLMAVTGLMTLLAYCVYIYRVHHASTCFLLTLPFAALGLSRFYRLTAKNQPDDDPIAVFFSDQWAWLILIVFIGLTLMAISPT